MADIQLANQSLPSTPSSGNTVVYIDSTSKRLKVVNDTGFRDGDVSNGSTTSQAVATTSRTYLAGSALAVPGLMQAGTYFEWVISVTKTGAGTAASTYDICFGTTGTTSDTARVSFTKPAGSANADAGLIRICCLIRSIGASGVAQGHFTMTHNLTTTGHMAQAIADVQTTSSGFDMTVANLIAGVCVTAGASDSLTFTIVRGKGENL